ncbi:DNA-binding response regulator, OmpR family, contains REC and winged-helix (wHTH) domain [Anaerocolumna jejuensis DSM 15929]|uniref:Stage 0 sporulation protein A homolog n=1 Tax=Anaerocolumna jejuensis DSM 15929 TaxID=1121322 RepID=A0A1M6L2D8_9FIRM|nr:response regulator transcription factor [Anaerocolumna jejuensis]SHJ65314.1 DNA-binding response regulator, OmpR family, contains REC and winged-helix (wHTH) domain [Anaerocolumna jejuensis DSM 15929]
MKKILIVEDDELIAELEKDYLEASNYETETVGNGILGMKYAKEKDYDLILLDVMLPGLSGFEICRELRKDMDIPIIMVTAKGEDIDKIRGLGLGVDDYIVKPFSPSELVARVKAHLGIHERLLFKNEGAQKKNEEINIKQLRILPLSRRVYVNDQEVILANKEFELLLFLARNPNIVFSKEVLFDRVWGMDAMGDASTVTVHINRLREKIEADTSKPEYIDTVWGAGYRFQVK